jgi:hypothetical protein
LTNLCSALSHADGFRGKRRAEPGWARRRAREKRRSGTYSANTGRGAPPLPKHVRLPGCATPRTHWKAYHFLVLVGRGIREVLVTNIPASRKSVRSASRRLGRPHYPQISRGVLTSARTNAPCRSSKRGVDPLIKNHFGKGSIGHHRTESATTTWLKHAGPSSILCVA